MPDPSRERALAHVTVLGLESGGTRPATSDTRRPHPAVNHSPCRRTALYDLVRLPARALDAEAAQRAFYLGYTRSYPVEVLARKR